MSKLPKSYQFIDLSDYGRPIARSIANALKSSQFTPIHVTIGFIISGLIGILCIYIHYYWFAALFIIFKSILDAADGELARVKNTPSYTGRYFDSIADILLNALIFFILWKVTDIHFWWAILGFIGIQLQGTLYNYYYVIMRNQFNGDTTSRVFEDKAPIALPGESQKTVNVLFAIYKLLYGLFDKAIYWIDPSAAKSKNFPKWFMTALSTFGLGFQLLLISLMLILKLEQFIIPFFIAYTCMILAFVEIRKHL